MFEKRKRRKLAVHHLHEAIAEEYGLRGINPHGPSAAAMQQAMYDAGYGRPGDPSYTLLVVDVHKAAKERLSAEDRFLVSKGREGQDPFAEG